MNEMQTYQPKEAEIARTPKVLGAEIRNLTSAARYLNVYYAVEIGRRLTEAKALLAHGEWLDWLKNETEFSQPTASRFMRVYAEYGADQGNLFGAETKYSTLNNLSISNALRLLAVPEEERVEFAAEVDAEHITAKELEAAIRERDEAMKALQATAEELEEARQLSDEETARAEAAEKRVKELENRPIDVAVQEPDPAEIERRVQEATQTAERKLAEEKEKAKAERDKLKEKLKAAEEKLAGAGAEDKAAAEQLQAEVAALKKQLSMSGEEMVTFKLRFEAWQEAYAAMLRALAALDEEKAAKGIAAIRAACARWGAA